MILEIVAIGTGATLAYDLWTVVRRRWLAMPLPDWRRIGRWLAGLPRGRFVLAPDGDTPPVRGEAAVGWGFHYAVGIAFAAALVALAGAGWLQAPTLAPALAVGVATSAAPFVVLQPGLGIGLFARRAARPWIVRLHTLLGHAMFGVGLHLTALAWRALVLP
jgi:hypothetical protein